MQSVGTVVMTTYPPRYLGSPDSLLVGCVNLGKPNHKVGLPLNAAEMSVCTIRYAVCHSLPAHRCNAALSNCFFRMLVSWSKERVEL